MGCSSEVRLGARGLDHTFWGVVLVVIAPGCRRPARHTWLTRPPSAPPILGSRTGRTKKGEQSVNTRTRINGGQRETLKAHNPCPPRESTHLREALRSDEKATERTSNPRVGGSSPPSRTPPGAHLRARQNGGHVVTA